MTHNAVARRLRDGIRVAAFEPEVPTLDNVVRDNWSTTRRSMGCRSEPRATGRVTGTVLGRNLALRSSDDWIADREPADDADPQPGAAQH